MQLRPYGSRLLIRKYSDEVTEGGIFIPNEVKKVSLRAKVLEVGPDCSTVEVGDDIFIATHSPIEVATKYYQDTRASYHKENEENLYIMNEDDILIFAENSSEENKNA